ncbi:MAG: tRNA preQ1(34) S-adenosylmethionine ribosyltransferase-isomerase QueA [Clostridiaceae bacterium]|jgi:S-adenosylmethionine:tRNA ribosyltransferase-isomerase|nr:tRNA preQ1(34) S-adenosylmethionine ribosyltransferase-isomerase QueA [Clostridiaceae bacterium]
MKTKDFYYDLPEELIAQLPAEPRDASRLLVHDGATGEIFHRRFYDIGRYLRDDDLLVVNNTKVIPARLFGVKLDASGVDGGAAVEVLLLKRLDLTNWEALARPGKRIKKGTVIRFSDGLTAVCEADCDEGVKRFRFVYDGVFEDIINRIGVMPLPPYIKEALKEKSRYQTVYAKTDGSAAAPTAGFHFTEELMASLKGRGIEFAEVLLHIGLSTFRPVKSDEISGHKMHEEYYEIGADAADKINRAKKDGRRIVAVGTTSVRTLESASDENGLLQPCSGTTSIFIHPPYRFKVVDALITNFHLPESTLIMLVSALVGREEALRVYGEAVKERYRFFSFGDACFFY